MDILSDHCPVMFDIRVSSYQDNIQTLPEVEDYRFVWNTEQKSTYLNNLNRHIGDFDAALSIVTEEPLSRHTINEGITAFTKVLDITAEPFRRRIRSGHLSLRRNKLNHPPWWNAECGDKKRLFHRAWDAYKYRATDDNFDAYKGARRQYKNACRYYRNRHMTQRVNNLGTNMNTDPKQFWEALKGGRRKPAKMPSISDEELFTHFSRLNGTRPRADTPFDAHIEMTLQEEDPLCEGDVILDADITQDEVTTAIRKLKSGKCSGLDKIITELFIYGGYVLVPFLTKLFNCVLMSGVYPAEWAKGVLRKVIRTTQVITET
jgi:hypothetical protein